MKLLCSEHNTKMMIIYHFLYEFISGMKTVIELLFFVHLSVRDQPFDIIPWEMNDKLMKLKTEEMENDSNSN